ncbi:unnamed protein product [Sphenostylis stenocarpa]|uniref:Uncharacterized protein n=1 Tax=Sphenostylis stenocarpa TaxID=92480 RepID=A0AA86VFQ1_9FABA|nr:unnamed protein product [Sphenostylis stenocarpa]
MPNACRKRDYSYCRGWFRHFGGSVFAFRAQDLTLNLPFGVKVVGFRGLIVKIGVIKLVTITTNQMQM